MRAEFVYRVLRRLRRQDLHLQEGRVCLRMRHTSMFQASKQALVGIGHRIP
jgi:hypothetical protein